jgi:hypothetical protein
VAQWLKKSFGITVRRSNALGLTGPESILVRADRVIQCAMPLLDEFDLRRCHLFVHFCLLFADRNASSSSDRGAPAPALQLMPFGYYFCLHCDEVAWSAPRDFNRVVAVFSLRLSPPLSPVFDSLSSVTPSFSAASIDAPAYRITAVEQGDIVATVQAAGTLNAVVTVDVGSQISGQIRSFTPTSIPLLARVR